MYDTIINGYRVGPYKDLHGTNLCRTDLSNMDLYGANLCCSDMREAYLERTNFTGANLYKTFLDKNQVYRKGEKLKENIIGYKKCTDIPPQGNIGIGHKEEKPLIVELVIPRGAIVFGINGSKFRTDKAIVKDIYDYDGNHYKRAYSYYQYFSYYVGDEIEVFNFNTEYNVECGEGIHFFKTKEEAINW